MGWVEVGGARQGCLQARLEAIGAVRHPVRRDGTEYVLVQPQAMGPAPVGPQLEQRLKCLQGLQGALEADGHWAVRI
jgi:hypothetical protein